MPMTSKQRMVTALDGGMPDRLPVTTHHVMDFFLNKYMNGISYPEFFDHFDLDAIRWVLPILPNASDDWRITSEELSDPQYHTQRYTITTPKGTLTTVTQSNEHTTWVAEHLIKEKRDIDLIGEFVTAPQCDVEQVNREADDFGERGLIRGHIPSFDIFGQPGTWQDAACLVGIEKLILATYDDPEWGHELLGILFRRKETFVKSLKGARYDVLELGGGDASSTVISPKLFRKFVAPYDSKLIALAHEAGTGGGFILSPSDHFFNADLNLIAAYADEARECVY